jgi:hypothetical protein
MTPAEYRSPVLGLIFLAFAEHRFEEIRPEVELKATERRPVSADDFRAHGVLFVPFGAPGTHSKGAGGGRFPSYRAERSLHRQAVDTSVTHRHASSGSQTA